MVLTLSLQTVSAVMCSLKQAVTEASESEGEISAASILLNDYRILTGK